MPVSGWPDAAPASGHYAPNPRMATTCPSSNIVYWSLRVTKRSTRSQRNDRTHSSEWPDSGPHRVRSSPVSSPSDKNITGHVRSGLTWYARCPVSTLCPSTCSPAADVINGQRSSHAGPTRQIHSVRASVKVTECAGQRPGSTRCEALALGLACAAENNWPDADISVRSLSAQRPVDEQRFLFNF
jgi:hypothetical protein